MNLLMCRYASELDEDGDSGRAVDLEAGAKDDTVSGEDLHSSRDVPFSRSWIDRDHTDESSNPRVCPIRTKVVWL
jgi:hypothetical protein